LRTCFKCTFSLTFKTALRFLTILALFAAKLSIANNGKIVNYINSLH
jgi:hypothetical protein